MNLDTFLSIMESTDIYFLKKIEDLNLEIKDLELTSGEMELMESKTVLDEVFREKEEKFSALHFLVTEDEVLIKNKKNSDILESNLQKLLVFYNTNLESFTTQYLESLSLLQTKVYSNLFQNETKSIRLIIGESRGKKVIQIVTDRKYNGKIYEEEFTSNSGSEKALLGLVLQIYYILVTGIPRILFIDETFSALHPDVLDRTLKLLRTFVEELDFKFMIIDHRLQVVKKYADKIYVIDDGTMKEFWDKDSGMSKNNFGGLRDVLPELNSME